MLASTALAGGSHSGGHDDEAIGKPGIASKITRTVNVEMKDDMRFYSSDFQVEQGETIRFLVKNTGQVAHEMVLGTEQDLKQHNEVMKKHPRMEHADANMVTVAPGKTGEIVWQFTKAGKVNFACLQPGHYEAGMKGVVSVSRKSTAPATKVAQAAQAAASADLTHGEIRKVDKENKKITIKHGVINNLDMPAMTMVFQVKDPTMLDRVNVGDKVTFAAEESGGALVVTEMQVNR